MLISDILGCCQTRTFSMVPHKIVLNVPGKNEAEKLYKELRSSMLTVAGASMETKHHSKTK